ncbi:MAG: hypothetical protein HFH27_11860 [Clostridiaceae bacterium]|nr:hypothetical protein [Clostridiaceae bacterium]MCI9485133.1 hypothetical protein [Clostridiaceae bacterium]
MEKGKYRRFEAGLLAAVTVLFLYAPAGEPERQEGEPELRLRTFEIVQELAGWFGLSRD